jgi:hypothetical protein
VVSGAERRPFKVESLVWYICAMSIKIVAMLALVLAFAEAPVAASAQTSSHAGARPSATQDPPSATTPSEAAPQSTPGPAPKSDCDGFPCDAQPPHVVVTLPAPVQAPWLWRDRIAWGASLVLALVGYVGIMLALSLLKKIERQTRFAEAAAETASNSAQAALLHAQSIIDSERPWLLITAEPAQNKENSFTVMATNRGRSPATIVSTAEQIRIVVDESHLPSAPAYEKKEPVAPLVPIILLPGESAGIKPFSREDLRGVCQSDEAFKRVEDWEERVFLYGKVIYRDLIAPDDKQIHETNWCCWYIHGRLKSGLVIAGPREYNLHT